jgi:hypothetical protein
MKKIITFTFLLPAQLTFAQNGCFFPKESQPGPAIPSPEQFPGYLIGECHTWCDRLISGSLVSVPN